MSNSQPGKPQTSNSPGPSAARRVLVWSLMACAIFWTLVYRKAQPTSSVPEFIYGNF